MDFWNVNKVLHGPMTRSVETVLHTRSARGAAWLMARLQRKSSLCDRRDIYLRVGVTAVRWQGNCLEYVAERSLRRDRAEGRSGWPPVDRGMRDCCVAELMCGS